MQAGQGVIGAAHRVVGGHDGTGLVDLLLETRWWDFNYIDLPPHWSDPKRIVTELVEKEAAGELRLSGLHFGIAAGILTKLTGAKRFERLD